MESLQKQHQEEHQKEQLVRAFGTHWIKYVGPFCIYLLLTSVSLLLFFLVATFPAERPLWLAHIVFLMALTLLLFAHHRFFHKLLSEYMEDVIITTKRIIYLEACIFFCDDTHEIPFERIHGVEAQKHGIIQNLLGYGSIWIDTGGSTSLDVARVIPRVPHPEKVVKDILRVLEV
jgi:uncharacterized membrane protein YdbT with pleckstrin-like domain